jgi:16S rRNA (adenine1518-N6/adenine1519-N6)-dimethyltransferase
MDQLLLNQAREFILKHGADIKKDQFFLVDSSVIKKLVDIAEVTAKDVVLEVGPGLGFLTAELSQRAKKVIAIEIDKAFQPYLSKLPANVQVIDGDAYKLLNNHQFTKTLTPPTKVVSNIPYSRAQNMLHNYTNVNWCSSDLFWICPASMVNKVNEEPILSAYFKAELRETIPQTAFFPQPKTASAIVCFRRLPDPQKTGNFNIFFRRWLYNHEEWKVKNALREGVIAAANELKGLKVTKNQVRNLIADLGLPQAELEKLTNNIRPEYYFEIPERLSDWYNALSPKR